MAMSEEDRRNFDMLVGQLAEDPKFALSMQQGTLSVKSTRNLVLGVCAVILGLVIIFIGVNTSLWFIGIAGFLAMIAGGVYAVSGRSQGSALAEGFAAGMGSKASKGGFMQNLENKWDRRRQENP